jgi:hypothetical protein
VRAYIRSDAEQAPTAVSAGAFDQQQNTFAVTHSRPSPGEARPEEMCEAFMSITAGRRGLRDKETQLPGS